MFYFKIQDLFNSRLTRVHYSTGNQGKGGQLLIKTRAVISDKDGKPDNRFKFDSRKRKRNQVTDVKEPVCDYTYILQ